MLKKKKKKVAGKVAKKAHRLKQVKAPKKAKKTKKSKPRIKSKVAKSPVKGKKKVAKSPVKGGVREDGEKVVKKGRPKGAKNKKTLVKEAREEELRKLGIVEPKRKRGRPRGSKNAKTIENDTKMKILSANEDHALNVMDDDVENDICEDLEVTNIKSYRFLGYCRKCNFGICTCDLEDARSVKAGYYNCPGCQRRGKITRLSTECDKSDDIASTRSKKSAALQHPRTEHYNSPETPYVNQHERDIQDLLEKKIATDGFIETE